MGAVAQPLRVALTGGTVSPPLGDTLAVLGKDAVLRRINRCLKTFGAA
jgi:glutamyl-tRNA synthetase